MQTYTSKLIILRGNSAAGKSTVAKRLREISSQKIAYVAQVNIRREILKEKETDDAANNDLIAEIVEFALRRDYDVILEGMLKFHRYGKMLKVLVANCPNNYVFYFDVGLEETLRRHATKPISKDVDEAALRSWYKHKDITGFKNEILIPESYSIEQSVRFIKKSSGI